MACELVDGSIFLHVPKTGGLWVCDVLEKAGLIRRPVGRHPHITFERAIIFPNGVRKWKEWGRAENWKPENWLRPGHRMKLPFTFCFVRHPVRWYESWWRYTKGGGGVQWMEESLNKERYIKRWDPFRVPYTAFCEDFNEFVARVLKAFPGYVTWMYGCYAVPEVDYVGKQENLVEDLVAVLKMRGLPFDETRVRQHPRINEAGTSRAAIRWDEGLLRDVQAAETAALLRFGYPVLSLKDVQVSTERNPAGSTP